MNVEQLKEDVREGRIDADRLVDLVVTLQRELQEARRRIEALEKNWGLGNGQSRRTVFVACGRAAARSSASETGRCGAVGSPQRTRLPRRERTEKVFPVGVAQRDCQRSHTRPVWRLEHGQAVLVAYEIHRGPKSQFGRIPGVMGRSEFGIEIIVAITY